MTTTRIRVIKYAAAVVSSLAMVWSAMAQSEQIYDNTGSPLNSVYTSNLEFGDEINFAGQNRQVSRIQFEYNGNLTPAATKIGTFRLYANDGAGNAPGTVLYTSPTFDVLSGSQQVSITSLAFTVPETVTWTLSFSGLAAGEAAGALLYDPPIFGSSANDFWQKDAGGVWVRNVLDPLPANFGARITAVPEPTVLQLGLLGGLVLGGYALRRRTARI